MTAQQCQWLPYSVKVLDQGPFCVKYACSPHGWVPFRCCSFLLQPTDIQVGLIGDSKLPLDVNMSVSDCASKSHPCDATSVDQPVSGNRQCMLISIFFSTKCFVCVTFSPSHTSDLIILLLYPTRYHFATLYDTNHRIAVYSAYYFQPSNGGGREKRWFVEPQVGSSCVV